MVPINYTSKELAGKIWKATNEVIAKETGKEHKDEREVEGLILIKFDSETCTISVLGSMPVERIWHAFGKVDDLLKQDLRKRMTVIPVV